MRKIVKSMLLVCLGMLFCSSVVAYQHRETVEKKTGIMLVAFGTTIPEANKAFVDLENEVKKTFPDIEIKWAFTSKIVQRKLQKAGKQVDSPLVALSKMIDDGYTDILIASFHTMPGEEFHKLCRDVQALSQASESEGRRFEVSKPLFSSTEEMDKIGNAVLDRFKGIKNHEDAVILMGHGNKKHVGDSVYPAFAYFIQKIDSNFFVATVDGRPSIEEIIPILSEKKIKKVWLAPLMAVAGDHARNNMCGNTPDSWKSMLTKDGFQVECIMEGTSENPKIREIWIDHLKVAFDRLKL
ncbi:MAG: sirohydrochlorin cobaltochelatase [Deltaproteobacteria bacterium]|nr:sirohydrochlorin cobaltochelatase [Deltaproteobacteria bacterium]